MSNTEKKTDPLAERAYGAKTAYMTSCSYLQEMIKEMGPDRTYALMTASDSERGKKVGKMIREQEGGEEFDLDKILNTILKMANDIGASDTVLDVTENKAVTVTEFGRCPIYEAAKEIGMNDKEIEAMCRAGSLPFLNSVVKEFNKDFCYRVTAFRSKEHGGCVEEIAHV